MTPTTAPDEGRLALIPAGGCAFDGLLDLGPGLEASALQRKERMIFHQGSIRFRQAAYLGWKTNSQRGWSRLNKSTSGALWVLRVSTTA